MKFFLSLLSFLFATQVMARPHGNVFTPTPGRTIIIDKVIDQSALKVADDILFLADKSGEGIDIVINSPGGSIAVGRVIIQAMNIAHVRGHKTRCAVVSMAASMAASMAFSILANCSERYALPEANMLYHPPRVQAFQVTITPEMAAVLASELRSVSHKIVVELLGLYPVDHKFFMKHYRRESWHTAADLNAAPGLRYEWIKEISDIDGLSSLVGEVKLGESSAVDDTIIYQFVK